MLATAQRSTTRTVLAVVSCAALAAGFSVADQPRPADAADNGSTYERSTTVIGKSVQGRDIKAFFRGDPDATHRVVLIGQVHGDEKAGVSVSRQVLRRLEPEPGTAVWVIPTANPDGNALHRRQNANGVDLNRNFPTNGWSGAASSCCWGGPRAGSAPETKALVRFLSDVRPDYVAAMHQPYGVVAANGKDGTYERRLARELHLGLDEVSIGHGNGRTVAPSLTSWYNARFPKAGTSVTIEFNRSTTARYRTRVAAPGLMRATRLWTGS